MDTSAEDRLGYSSPRFAARLFHLAFIILILPSSSIEPGGKPARGPVRVGGGAGGLAGHVGIERSSDRERAVADREEAKRLLSEDLTYYADGMAAAWRLLVALPKEADQDHAQAVFEAVAYMAKRVSRPEAIATYRSMAEILGWDRRRSYSGLLRGLEELRQFIDPNTVQRDPDEVLDVIRRLADEFEYCLPDTSRYFTGLWRRSHKARTFADWVETQMRKSPMLWRRHSRGAVVLQGKVRFMWPK